VAVAQQDGVQTERAVADRGVDDPLRDDRERLLDVQAPPSIEPLKVSHGGLPEPRLADNAVLTQSSPPRGSGRHQPDDKRPRGARNGTHHDPPTSGGTSSAVL
jgi:hypothetical protein